jgi:hypothetical protein
MVKNIFLDKLDGSSGEPLGQDNRVAHEQEKTCNASLNYPKEHAQFGRNALRA